MRSKRTQMMQIIPSSSQLGFYRHNAAKSNQRYKNNTKDSLEKDIIGLQ